MMVGNYVSSRGSFTNFMSLFGLLSQATIGLTEDGKISLPALDGLGAGARDWVEVEPFVWRDTGTGERLAAEVKDGRVVRWIGGDARIAVGADALQGHHQLAGRAGLAHGKATV